MYAEIWVRIVSNAYIRRCNYKRQKVSWKRAINKWEIVDTHLEGLTFEKFITAMSLWPFLESSRIVFEEMRACIIADEGQHSCFIATSRNWGMHRRSIFLSVRLFTVFWGVAILLRLDLSQYSVLCSMIAFLFHITFAPSRLILSQLQIMQSDRWLSDNLIAFMIIYHYTLILMMSIINLITNRFEQ